MTTTASERRAEAKARHDRRTATHEYLLAAQAAVNEIPLALGDMPKEVTEAILDAMHAVRYAQSLVKKEVRG